MDRSPRCNIPSFVETCPLVSEKKIITIYGRGSHLGYVAQMPRTNLRVDSYKPGVLFIGHRQTEKPQM